MLPLGIIWVGQTWASHRTWAIPLRHVQLWSNLFHIRDSFQCRKPDVKPPLVGHIERVNLPRLFDIAKRVSLTLNPTDPWDRPNPTTLPAFRDGLAWKPSTKPRLLDRFLIFEAMNWVKVSGDVPSGATKHLKNERFQRKIPIKWFQPININIHDGCFRVFAQVCSPSFPWSMVIRWDRTAVHA